MSITGWPHHDYTAAHVSARSTGKVGRDATPFSPRVYYSLLEMQVSRQWGLPDASLQQDLLRPKLGGRAWGLPLGCHTSSIALCECRRMGMVPVRYGVRDRLGNIQLSRKLPASRGIRLSGFIVFWDPSALPNG